MKKLIADHMNGKHVDNLKNRTIEQINSVDGIKTYKISGLLSDVLPHFPSIFGFSCFSPFNFLVFILLMPLKARATSIACPVCAVAIASGLGLSRALGVRDAVVGVWMGALLLALSHGTIIWLQNKKNWRFIWLDMLIYAATYSLLLPLYLGSHATLIFNLKTIVGVDEFLFSVLIGSLTLFSSSKFYQFMKNKNGKPHFPFEKVALPIGALLLTSVIFQLLGTL